MQYLSRTPLVPTLVFAVVVVAAALASPVAVAQDGRPTTDALAVVGTPVASPSPSPMLAPPSPSPMAVDLAAVLTPAPDATPELAEATDAVDKPGAVDEPAAETTATAAEVPAVAASSLPSESPIAAASPSMIVPPALSRSVGAAASAASVSSVIGEVVAAAVASSPTPEAAVATEPAPAEDATIAQSSPPAVGGPVAIVPTPATSTPGPVAETSASPLFRPSARPADGSQPASSPTPVLADAAMTTTPTASGPPRRLVTSFAALRGNDLASGATQLRAMATGTSLLLGVPFHSQIDGTPFSLVNCGPASLAMVLTAFGLDVDPAAIRDYLNYLVGNYDTEQGTSLYTLTRIASEAGLHTFNSPAGGLQGWTVDAIREQVRAGHPVITLTKYRRLPGHFGSVTDFDHYIVIDGLAGDDFVYNDAAYASEFGRNLLISPSELERAWADSSNPRHAVAIGLGDSLRPLPIAPPRVAPANPGNQPAASPFIVAATPRPLRSPALEQVREQMLERLGARPAADDGR